MKLAHWRFPASVPGGQHRMGIQHRPGAAVAAGTVHFENGLRFRSHVDVRFDRITGAAGGSRYLRAETQAGFILEKLPRSVAAVPQFLGDGTNLDRQ